MIDRDCPPSSLSNVLPINQIVCGNHLTILSSWRNNCVDLTITSPPYDNLRDYKGYNFNFKSLAEQLYQITKEGGIVVWVVGDATVKGSETGTSFKQALYFKSVGFNLHDTMIYSKAGFSHPAKNRYHQTFEYMFVFSKGRPKTFNPIRDRKNKWGAPWGKITSRAKDGSLKEVKREIKNSEYGQRWNIWHYSTGKGNHTRDEIAYEHPAIFPEKLAHDHILSWSNIGDIVLDPMCGSGTTCKEAKKLYRNYIGIDIADEYCKIAQQRLRS